MRAGFEMILEERAQEMADVDSFTSLQHAAILCIRPLLRNFARTLP
jgi:hypothetical protein